MNEIDELKLIDNIWTVYMHITPNLKYYIGITSQKAEYRWGKDGCNYRSQIFKNAINKYGWDNIEHKIIATNLSKQEAKEI